MKNLKPLAAGVMALCFAAAAPVQADTLFGLYAGAGTWQQSYSGNVRSGISNVDIEDDLGLDDDDSVILYAALEHGVPVLPNVRAQYYTLDVDADSVLSRTIEFNGEIFNLSETVSTAIDLTQTDAVLYYELLDNVVSLDLGLVVSLVEGSIEVASLTERASADIDEVVPMLYAAVRADLPFSGLWIGAQAQGISYDDNTLIGFDAKIGYESSVGLGIEAGYRAVQVELDAFDDVDLAEIDVKGPYAAINFHF
ncbi:MAG: TIGR04219 family outer membrane beta-barrel protein [bacterium]